VIATRADRVALIATCADRVAMLATRALALGLLVAACGAPDPAATDAAIAIDAPADPWATYTIAAGQHPSTITGGGPGNPLRAIATAAGRDYLFALNPSAQYVLTMPTQPDDQLDWNKLPGLSDCGTVDLSDNGLMFGWRWRTDLDPQVLEVTAYANNDGVHLTVPTMVTLGAAELAADAPLRYRLAIDGDRYRFTITGDLAGRPIDAAAELPRICPAVAADFTKWAAGFYFGGTSVAPQPITARISEQPFVPGP
jgi:hypothetical protein